MIVMVLWILMDNEDDLVVLGEDFRDDSMLEILVIFSHHSLVEGWVEDDDHHVHELISEKMSRSDSGYHSKMLYVVVLGVSSSIVLLLAITVVDEVERPRLVIPAMDTGK